MPEAEVIANWKPSEYTTDTIRKEFMQFMREKGFSLAGAYIEIRNPIFNNEIFLGLHGPLHWHRDDYGADHRFLMWSNINPTEVKFSDGTPLEAKDGDVIYIENKPTMHKFPTQVTGERWFIRAPIYKTNELPKWDW